MRRAPAPTVDDHVLQELEEMSPRVFLEWNPTFRSYEKWDTKVYEGRWEIWCELRHSSHPDADNKLAKTDRWNTDKQCWMRKLQVYETADGEFAPADERLLIGLKMADAWADRRFYEDHVERAYDAQEARKLDEVRMASRAGANYYRNIDSTSVGGSVNSGWRWRIR